MAGIQIDGVNNKIDFDDDLDTSISANTDDTLVFEIAGATDFTMTANTFTAASGSTIAAQALTATTVTATGDISLDGGNFVFNESSADKDFRVESNNNTHALFVEGSDGGIGIGVSSIEANAQVHIEGAEEYLVIKHAGQMGIKLYGDDTNVLYSYDKSGNSLTGGITFNHADGTTIFNTGGSTERMRMDSVGRLTLGGFADNGGSAGRIRTLSDANDNYVAYFTNSGNSTPYGAQIQFSGATPDDNAKTFFNFTDGTVRCTIFSDGDIKNHDNSYGSLSDERIKQDIRDSNSQWDDIKAVKVRNFKKKDDVRQYADKAWEQIGVVAQELEKVSPKLIRHNNPSSCDILSDSSFGTLWTKDDSETQDAVLYTSDDQEVIDGIKNVGDIKKPSTKQIGDVKEVKEQVKSVNYSILYMKAIKALQEAQTRIETLETKVAALEG